MRKIVLLMAIVIASTVSLAAQDASDGSGPAIRSDINIGLWDHIYTNTGSDVGDIASTLLGLRGGIVSDLTFGLSDLLGIGGEVGLAYFTINSASLIDIPLNAKVALTLGDWFKLEAFAGAFFQIAIANIAILWLDADFGARVNLGPIFIEAAYLIPLAPNQDIAHPRVGLGYHATLVGAPESK